MWRKTIRRAGRAAPAPFDSRQTDLRVRNQARSVVDGRLSRDAFLTWFHDTVGHEDDRYESLAEMGCLPETADAGEGRWWRESAEAAPLRAWTDQAIAALARGETPHDPPEGWTVAIFARYQ